MAGDFYWHYREYGAARRALVGVRDSIGPDPLLDAVEAMLLAKTGQFKAAAAAADRAVQADPELRGAYLGRIAVAIEARDNATALVWMKRGVERTGLRFGDLRRNPRYAAFVRSPEYQEWLTWMATRPNT